MAANVGVIGRVAGAAEQQASGAQAVRGRVETIHAQAERSAQVVMQTTASSKVLDDLAAQLRASLGQFRSYSERCCYAVGDT